MVGPLELHDPFAPGVGAGHPLAIHRRLGAGGAKAQPFGGRAHPADLLGNGEGVRVQVGEVRAPRGLCGDRRHDLGVGVTDEHRAPAHGEVDPLATGGVPDPAALAPLHHDQVVAREAELAVHLGLA
jgi:hypothetical protein